MADRWDLLRRLATAVSRPGVDSVLGTADIVEDLLLIGALDEKVVIGSMNRGGLAGTAFEIDDRFTGYDAAALGDAACRAARCCFASIPTTCSAAPTMQACARAIGDLASRGLLAMVPSPSSSHRTERVRNDLNCGRRSSVGDGRCRPRLDQYAHPG